MINNLEEEHRVAQRLIKMLKEENLTLKKRIIEFEEGIKDIYQKLKDNIIAKYGPAILEECQCGTLIYGHHLDCPLYGKQ